MGAYSFLRIFGDFRRRFFSGRFISISPWSPNLTLAFKYFSKKIILRNNFTANNQPFVA